MLQSGCRLCVIQVVRDRTTASSDVDVTGHVYTPGRVICGKNLPSTNCFPRHKPKECTIVTLAAAATGLANFSEGNEGTLSLSCTGIRQTSPMEKSYVQGYAYPLFPPPSPHAPPPFHPVLALGEQVHPGYGRCAVLASNHHHIGRREVRCASGRRELCEAFYFIFLTGTCYL